ncbi:MAG: flavodoxin family protein [Candidatus Omnitrophica bacterium]|nr:flavodoxin family protein [Candidatus Omnitrophota bacterium]
MYVLGINGSPRIHGNTDTLLDKALEGAKSKGAEVEKVILNTFRIMACQECEYVRDDGTCILEDDFQPVYEKIKKADAIIIASPIFFGSLSAQTKIMIDRFQCDWRYKYILNKEAHREKTKRGAFISVEASKRQDFFDNAKSIVKNFFVSIDAAYKLELFCQGIEGKEDILKHPDYLDKAFELGKDLVE